MPKASDEDELIVRVYFGSWSPICERIVPKIMAVEEAWRFVRFEYYGLPKPLSDDELARSQGITGLQTVLVLRGGEEVARLTGRQLDSPEEAFSRGLRRSLIPPTDLTPVP
jgi:thiol-disulfide isomerase/thioredoxin